MKGALESMLRKYKRFFTYGALALALSTFIISRTYVKCVQPNENKEWVYVVKEGDCLSIIAEKYVQRFEKIENVVAEIKFRNNVNEVIYPGQVLYVPDYKY
jgi:LysM repeat protein